VGAYLEDRGWSSSLVSRVLQSLERLGYINDLELARLRAERCLLEQGWGPRKVAAELARRGVEEAVWREVLSELGSRVSEEELARRVLEKKFGKEQSFRGRRERVRAFRFLVGRGFCPAIAATLLELDEAGCGEYEEDL